MKAQSRNVRTLRGRLATLALALLVVALTGMSARAADYQLIDLGIDVYPYDINNLGTIVGYRKTGTGNVAFRRPSGGVIEDIDAATIAYAINDSEQITGVTLTGAFLLDGSLTEWDGYSGFDINELGQISGNKQLTNPWRATPLPLDPAIYTPDQWDNLGIATTYPRGTRKGVYADLYGLNDINDAGFAVGSRSRYGIYGTSSILTTPAFDAVIYLPIPYGGTARAINNQNMVVGATGGDSSAGQYTRAYLYDYNADNLIDLGTLNNGLGLTSGAADINEHNQVVGGSWLVTELTSVYDPTKYHAFLWDDDDGLITDLNDAPAVANTGWILTGASAINDNGDIVGSGLLDGQVHGFLLLADQAPPVNEPPVAMASASVTVGWAPLTVDFSSAGSFDPDGTIVDYTWSFGDTTPDVSAANPSHVYTERGRYTAVLTVTDDEGLTASAEVTIRVRRSR